MSPQPFIVKRRRSTFSDAQRRWNLAGWAGSMYQWLRATVPGSASFRGWELAGTLDPELPDPARFRPPPPWITPDLLMRSLCAWYAGGLQDVLVSEGAVPLLRMEVDGSGNLVRCAGADVPFSTGKVTKAQGELVLVSYYVVVDQRGPHPLTDNATIQITSAGVPAPAAALHISNQASCDGYDLSGIQLQNYRGFLYTLNGLETSAHVHLYS